MGPKSELEIHLCPVYTLYTQTTQIFRACILTATCHIRSNGQLSICVDIIKVLDFGKIGVLDFWFREAYNTNKFLDLVLWDSDSWSPAGEVENSNFHRWGSKYKINLTSPVQVYTWCPHSASQPPIPPPPRVQIQGTPRPSQSIKDISIQRCLCRPSGWGSSESGRAEHGVAAWQLYHPASWASRTAAASAAWNWQWRWLRCQRCPSAWPAGRHQWLPARTVLLLE